jgi:hypothetical protein
MLMTQKESQPVRNIGDETALLAAREDAVCFCNYKANENIWHGFETVLYKCSTTRRGAGVGTPS